MSLAQIKQHVQIAEMLLAQYDQVLERMLVAWWNSLDDDGKLGKTEEMSVLGAEVQRLYAGAWEQLDDAQVAAQAAGQTTAAYAAIRAEPGLDRATAIRGVSLKLSIKRTYKETFTRTKIALDQNDAGLAAARAAVAAFQAAWPQIDWTPHVEPEVDLRPRGLLSRLFGGKKK
ncbi:MAG: hypothetical protein K8W52_17725 [Deltaproteobacteria bacterium]|nr:hypothetical protein [Deltaproteobacteria bacterium]